MRSATRETTARSCEMKSKASPARSRRSASRLTICAATETSSAETGSSQTSRRGPVASARAIATRWRCPPEKSDGNRAAVRREPDVGQQLPHALGERASPRQALHAQRLGDLIAGAHPRVQRALRILKDDLELRAGCVAARARQRKPVRPVEAGSRPRPAPRAAHEPAGGALAAAGLADEPERLAPARSRTRRPAARAGPRRRAPETARDREDLRQAPARSSGATAPGPASRAAPRRTGSTGSSARGRRPARTARDAASQGSKRSGQRGAKAQPASRPLEEVRAPFRRWPRSVAGRPPRRRERRHAAQEPPRVGMARGREELGGRGLLDDPSRVEDEDVVGVPRDDAEVVGDEEDRQVPLAPQAVEQLEDLARDRRVERRRRLVGNQHLRVRRQGDREQARCFSPPDSRCGYSPSTRAGSGNDISASRLDGAGGAPRAARRARGGGSPRRPGRRSSARGRAPPRAPETPSRFDRPACRCHSTSGQCRGASLDGERPETPRRRASRPIRARPSSVLPQPLSPAIASGLARGDVERHAVHRREHRLRRPAARLAGPRTEIRGSGVFAGAGAGAHADRTASRSRLSEVLLDRLELLDAVHDVPIVRVESVDLQKRPVGEFDVAGVLVHAAEVVEDARRSRPPRCPATRAPCGTT